MLKKVLMGTIASLGITGIATADSGTYIGAGVGYSYAHANTDINVTALDVAVPETDYYTFKGKALRGGPAFAGKLFAGYEQSFNTWSMLYELGYTLDTSEAKYGDTANSDKDLVLEGTADENNENPTIKSSSLKRKHTFSIGFGFKKPMTEKTAFLGGVDFLFSQFQVHGKSEANYNINTTNGVVKKKYRAGIAPWVGVSWNLGPVDAGFRYQYARYQQFKLQGDTVPNRLNINTKAKPEYHNFMLTVSKKF